MEKEDFLPDDYLKDLFRKQSTETPGDNFTDHVMEQIMKSPEVAPVKRSFYFLIKSSWPYVILSLVILVFLMTSDLPFSDYIPGKEYLIKSFLPAFNSLFSGLKPLVTNIKVIIIPVMVILAGSLLVGFDHLIFRRPGIRHQTTH